MKILSVEVEVDKKIAFYSGFVYWWVLLDSPPAVGREPVTRSLHRYKKLFYLILRQGLSRLAYLFQYFGIYDCYGPTFKGYNPFGLEFDKNPCRTFPGYSYEVSKFLT